MSVVPVSVTLPLLVSVNVYVIVSPGAVKLVGSADFVTVMAGACTGPVTVTAWEADLGWIVKMGKGDFVGREALGRQKEQGVPRKLVGFEMTDRGIARHGYPAQTAHGPGLVTSGTHSPTLGKPIGLALLPIAATAVGTEFQVDIRGRAAGARVVPTPFYKRSKEVPA